MTAWSCSFLPKAWRLCDISTQCRQVTAHAHRLTHLRHSSTARREARMLPQAMTLWTVSYRTNADVGRHAPTLVLQRV
jgi:hypothetical protein